MADAAASAAHPRAVNRDLGQIAVGVGIGTGVGALAAADGGYFAPAWGWTALVGLWLVIAWLFLGRAGLHGGVLAGIFAGGIVGLAAWTWLSLAWTGNSVQTVVEGFRMLAYAAVAAALVLVVRRDAAPALIRGVLAAIALISLYGLGTRLFPDRIGTYDPVSTYRLSEPIGYWNGLGIFVAIGLLLALGAVARERSTATRALAAAVFVLLVPALYFTFSRGAWIALGAGLIAAVALDPRRLQLVLAFLVVGIPGLAAAWIGSSSEALTRQDSSISAAADQGQEVAIFAVILALVAAGAAVGLAGAERRVVPSRKLRLGFAAVLLALILGAAAAGVVRLDGPVEMVDRAYDAFKTPPPNPENLDDRLFTFSGSYRPELWEESWNQFTDRPILGGGAGTYEQHWLSDRPIPHKVRDGHNLYLETLGELGPFGLALLILALGVPLVAALRARREPLAVGVFGAYVAYLVHAGVDWDWELPAVTVAALACGAALLALRGARDGEVRFGLRARVVVGAMTAVVAGAAFVGLIGSSALSASEGAATAATPDWNEAEDEARKAKRWAPWSSEPWQRLGEAQLGRGDNAAARESFRKAIDKEPVDWLLWFRLAEASAGADRSDALAEAERLNPLSPEVADLRREDES